MQDLPWLFSSNSGDMLGEERSWLFLLWQGEAFKFFLKNICLFEKNVPGWLRGGDREM